MAVVGAVVVVIVVVVDIVVGFVVVVDPIGLPCNCGACGCGPGAIQY
ncbi:hypothetical protein AGMMS49531_09980 [Endomicrobiia bacterium]|nr:hypothetical protein AGMMS49531_09980 [Endomicrobiia bacterium]